MLTTGPFALRTEKMSGAKGVMTTCAIEGPVPNVDEFRGIVVKKMRWATTTCGFIPRLDLLKLERTLARLYHVGFG
jgi:hypothetical protein